MKIHDYTEVAGAVHLHSSHSDGTLPIPEIARIASEKGLDFLMFSDHNTLAPKQQGLEGWYGNVLTLIGCELNDPDDRNHYLAFRIHEEVPTGLTPDVYVKAVKEAGGIGIIAHPAEKRNFSEAYPPYPWTAWDVDGFDGIEVWNQLSEWVEGVTRRNYLWRIMHPLRSIRYPVWETLERWDRLNGTRRVVGIGGIDVHGKRHRIIGNLYIQIYPYKVQFKSIRTHLLLDRPLESSSAFENSEKLIYEALTSGRAFIVNYSLGDGRGFQFYLESRNQHFVMGSRIKPVEQGIFYIKTPLSGKIRLLKNGCVIQRNKGATSLMCPSSGPGVYRVEVFRKKRGWIYSNPIVILSSN